MIDISNINWDELEWRPVREGIRTKVYHGYGATVTYNEANAGHTLRPHSHIHEQIVVWLAGVCDFYVDGVAQRMTAGSIMAIPPNVEHYAHCISEETCVNIDIFVPKRPEYLASEKIKK